MIFGLGQQKNVAENSVFYTDGHFKLTLKCTNDIIV
jgi:hypothetical protein